LLINNDGPEEARDGENDKQEAQEEESGVEKVFGQEVRNIGKHIERREKNIHKHNCMFFARQEARDEKEKEASKYRSKFRRRKTQGHARARRTADKNSAVRILAFQASVVTRVRTVRVHWT